MPRIRPLSDLPRVMEFRSNQVDKALGAAARKVARIFQIDVVRGTPVDTGKARSNWVANLDTPFRGDLPPYVPGRRLGIAESSNASAAIAQGLGVIARFSAVKNKFIHIRNNTPYIETINAGGSQQNSLFWQSALQRARVSIRNFRLLKSR